MSWRVVVVSNCAKLELKTSYLVIRTEADIKKIHLSEISVLIIESTAVSITAALLCELTKNRIKVIFCDEKRNPQTELVSFYGSHDTSLKIRHQINWKDVTKQQVWTEIIREKISNQYRLLRDLGCEEMKLLEQYIQELQFNDSTNREGHAAKVYFNSIFGKSFTRTHDNPINAGLNYGYAIILSVFNREIVAGGYITQLGLFHDNMFNEFNLSCDLMEPFRQLIDRKILSMEYDELGHDEKIQILSVLNDEVKIDGKLQYVSNAIRIYCKSVLDALNENDISLIRFMEYEL